MGVPASSGPSTPLPGWLGPVVAVTTQVGVPTVVAAVLLWFVLTRVDAGMQKIQAQEDLRTQFVAQMQKELIAGLREQTAATEAAIARHMAADDAHTERLERLFSKGHHD